MSRRMFLTVAAAVPGLFGLVMMLAPRMMLGNSLTSPAYPNTVVVTRWVGFAVFSIAWITFMSRDDGGSRALRAVMSGSALFHALGIAFDVMGYASRTMTVSGLVSGVVPHALLLVGFVWFLAREPDRGETVPV